MGKIVEAARDHFKKVIGFSKDSQDFIMKRAVFSEKYCMEKGWPTDATELSIDQLLEIRDQPEWVEPV